MGQPTFRKTQAQIQPTMLADVLGQMEVCGVFGFGRSKSAISQPLFATELTHTHIARVLLLCIGSFLNAGTFFARKAQDRDELAKMWFAFWLRIHLRCFQIKLETEMWLGRAAILSVLSACLVASETEGCPDGKCEDDQLELLQFKAPNGSSGSSGLKAKENVTSFGFNFNPSFGGIVPGHPLYKHL